MAKINYHKDVKIDPERAQIDVLVTVSPEEYMRVWEMAAERMAKSTSMPGFRKGHVPVSAVKSAKSNEISENAFNDMINSIVQEVVSESEQKPLSTVKINLEEHQDHEGDDHNHDVKFTLTYAYRITPKLPNLDDIKVERPKVEVTEEEINNGLDMLLKSVNSAPAKEGEEKQEFEAWNDEAIKFLNIPEVENIDQLKELVKSEITKQKDYENEVKYRSDILDAVAAKSEYTVPEMLIEDMVLQQEDDYRNRINNLGFEYDKYISEKNINLEDLRKEWVDMIKADLTRELILSQYVDDLKLEVSEEEIDRAVATADEQLKSRYTPEGLRQYMRYILLNNLAFSKIYGQVAQ